MRYNWAISTQLIASSFKTCAISVAFDAREGSSIHRLKHGGVAADAVSDIPG